MFLFLFVFFWFFFEGTIFRGLGIPRVWIIAFPHNCWHDRRSTLFFFFSFPSPQLLRGQHYRFCLGWFFSVFNENWFSFIKWLNLTSPRKYYDKFNVQLMLILIAPFRNTELFQYLNSYATISFTFLRGFSCFKLSHKPI